MGVPVCRIRNSPLENSEFFFGEMRGPQNSRLENLEFSVGELGVPVLRIRNVPLENFEFSFGGFGVLPWRIENSPKPSFGGCEKFKS
jgi:hypothetical protein